jgi:uncharacterized DUF497 family protein
MPVVFEWDTRKARSNYKKHGIGLTEAVSVFSNPVARISRTTTIPRKNPARLLWDIPLRSTFLLVCFTEPETDHIRIISARRATKSEQPDYEEDVAK